MSVPRQHHYLPQVYQNFFLIPDTAKVCVITLKEGEVFFVSPNKNAKKRDLYTSYKPPEKEKNTYIEENLSKIEAKYRSIIDRLITEKFISRDDRELLSEYLGYQRNRTPDFLKFIEYFCNSENNKPIYKKIFEKIINNPDIKKQFEEVGCNLNTFDSFFEDAYDYDEKQSNFSKDDILSFFYSISKNTAKIIKNMNWEILLTEERFFITSNRACAYSHDEIINFINNSREIKNSFLFFPLSSNICLRLHGDEGNISFKKISSEEVDDINEAIAYFATDFILGGDEDTLKKSLEMAKKRKTESEKVEKAIRDFDNILESLTRDSNDSK